MSPQHAFKQCAVDVHSMRGRWQLCTRVVSSCSARGDAAAIRLAWVQSAGLTFTFVMHNRIMSDAVIALAATPRNCCALPATVRWRCLCQLESAALL